MSRGRELVAAPRKSVITYTSSHFLPCPLGFSQCDSGKGSSWGLGRTRGRSWGQSGRPVLIGPSRKNCPTVEVVNSPSLEAYKQSQVTALRLFTGLQQGLDEERPFPFKLCDSTGPWPDPSLFKSQFPNCKLSSSPSSSSSSSG